MNNATNLTKNNKSNRRNRQVEHAKTIYPIVSPLLNDVVCLLQCANNIKIAKYCLLNDANGSRRHCKLKKLAQSSCSTEEGLCNDTKHADVGQCM